MIDSATTFMSGLRKLSLILSGPITGGSLYALFEDFRCWLAPPSFSSSAIAADAVVLPRCGGLGGLGGSRALPPVALVGDVSLLSASFGWEPEPDPLDDAIVLPPRIPGIPESAILASCDCLAMGFAAGTRNTGGGFPGFSFSISFLLFNSSALFLFRRPSGLGRCRWLHFTLRGRSGDEDAALLGCKTLRLLHSGDGLKLARSRRCSPRGRFPGLVLRRPRGLSLSARPFVSPLGGV